MSIITNVDIDRSYATLALLDVCAAGSAYMEEQGASLRSLPGNLTATIRHALELAGQTHDLLETLQRLHGPHSSGSSE